MMILTVWVGSSVKLITDQQLHDSELRVIMQHEENQCFACFSIIQEDMSRVTAGGGVCRCWVGRPRERGSASEQVGRQQGRWGWNLGSFNKWRWSKQKLTHLLQSKVFLIFSNVDKSLDALAFSAVTVFRRNGFGFSVTWGVSSPCCNSLVAMTALILILILHLRRSNCQISRKPDFYSF